MRCSVHIITHEHMSPKQAKPLASPVLARGFVKRCHPDLNRGIKVLQTFALPLGYGTGVSVRGTVP